MTEFKEGDKVKILAKNVTGEIIDVSCTEDGRPCYRVESDIPGPVDDPDAYPGYWPSWECLADQIQHIE